MSPELNKVVKLKNSFSLETEKLKKNIYLSSLKSEGLCSTLV